MAKRKLTSRTPSTRQVRVGKIHYTRGVYIAACDVSYIRLRGHWLTAAGFAPGDDITVHIRHGRLVLTRR